MKNLLASLFGRTRGEDFLVNYVVRECRRGRTFAEVIEDRYVVNRSTPQQRARLLERPEVVAAVGTEQVEEARLAGVV
ncbi:MAG TPA: hypothetical protein VFI37_13600 [Gaiellaceae bacterium]|jgi:hypothetical protein|nr:hypothetical protein [Gaiellaceae bacterium]